MTKFYAIQTGQTTWQEQSRLESSAGAPLTDFGAKAVLRSAKELSGRKIKIIYACDAGEPDRKTAELITRTLQVKVRNSQDLHELDYGLWQGLTMDEIKRSQPKVYRQWTKAPASICPPEGETLQKAETRLRTAVKEILKRQKNAPALLVLRPMVMGILRCLAEHEDVDLVWRHVDPLFRWGCYEVDEQLL